MPMAPSQTAAASLKPLLRFHKPAIRPALFFSPVEHDHSCRLRGTPSRGGLAQLQAPEHTYVICGSRLAGA